MFHIEIGNRSFGMVRASSVYGPDDPWLIREPGILRIGPVSFSWGNDQEYPSPGAEIGIGRLLLSWGRY